MHPPRPRRPWVAVATFLVALAAAAPPATQAGPGARGRAERARALAFLQAAHLPDSAAVAAWGGPWPEWQRRWSWGLGYYQTVQPWDRAGHYDRAVSQYAAWAQTGRADYRAWADSGAALEAAWLCGPDVKCGPQAWYLSLDGVAVRGLLGGPAGGGPAGAGGAASRNTVARIADHYLRDGSWWLGTFAAHDDPAIDPRTTARVLNTALLAVTLGVPSPQGVDYRARLAQLVRRALATQAPDGSFPAANQCGGDKGFMSGMLAEALVRVHDAGLADPAARAAIRRAVPRWAAFHWRAAVDTVPRSPTYGQARYITAECGESGGRGYTGELNGLMLTAHAFAAREAATDAERRAWLRRLDVLVHGHNGAWLGTKQFNQAWSSSFRAASLRAEALARLGR